MEKYHILVIDDDNRIRELLKQFLLKNGFLVTVAQDTKEARNHIAKYIFDLMVVDLMLPNESGIEFLKNIRKNDNIKTPAIMLTAMGDIDNKIKCFQNGCDDYLVKPFEPKELILRINNILNKQEKEDFCEFGPFIFDFTKQILTKNNEIVNLTDIETKILNILCKNINNILTREELIVDELNERSIDVTIARLRKKIEEDPKKSKFLRTIRNQGYILNN